MEFPIAKPHQLSVPRRIAFIFRNPSTHAKIFMDSKEVKQIGIRRIAKSSPPSKTIPIKITMSNWCQECLWASVTKREEQNTKTKLSTHTFVIDRSNAFNRWFQFNSGGRWQRNCHKVMTTTTMMMMIRSLYSAWSLEIFDTLKHDSKIHSMLFYSLTTRLKRV